MPIVVQFIGGPLDGQRAGIEDVDDDELMWFDYIGSKFRYCYRLRLGDLTARLEKISKRPVKSED